MKNATNKKAVTIKKTGTVIPAGTKLSVRFFIDDKSRPAMELTYPLTGETYKSVNYPNYFTPPSIRTMEKWMDTGIAKSVTGSKCEPDGYGDDDSPSWMLALGMI